MAFPDPATFFKAFGVIFLVTAMVGGFIFLLINMLRKQFPNFRLWFKYSVLKAKHNEEDVIQLMQYDDANMTVDDVKKLILLSGFDLKKANEFCYIYTKIQQKGGKIKNDK